MSREAVTELIRNQKERRKQQEEALKEQQDRIVDLAKKARSILDNEVMQRYFLDSYAVFLEWLFQCDERDVDTLLAQIRRVKETRNQELTYQTVIQQGRDIVARRIALEKEQQADRHDSHADRFSADPTRNDNFVDHLLRQTGDAGALDQLEEEVEEN